MTDPAKYPQIIKSPSDQREYLGLELSNQLKVLLISDPEADLAAAALSVHVGSMCDPWERQGLAHLLEHMLFMGSEKYPEENEYAKFVAQHGGSSNGSTSQIGTNFFFDVNPDFLEPALDRFVQFFINPLINPDSLARELEAVNSEFVTNCESDSDRLDRIFQILSSEKHDYGKFVTGSHLTLSDTEDTLRGELFQFYQKWYSANTMCLCVSGKESIADLTNMIVNKFSSIVDKKIEKPYWSTHPYDQKSSLRKVVKVVPVMDLHSITIRFAYPDEIALYKTDPSGYLTHLINLDCEGSLFSVLKDHLGYTTFVSSRTFGSDGFGFFEIDIDLTENGFENRDQVIQTVFQYIHFLRSEGPKEYIWDEIKALRETRFRFAEKHHPTVYVTHMTYMMQYYPFEDLLSAFSILDKFDPELITQMLSYLAPQNSSIVIRSQQFDGQTDKVEQNYEIDYQIADFTEDFINSLLMIKDNQKFSLPKANQFIPTNFEIIKFDNEPKVNKWEDVPVLIRNDHGLKVWFMQDRLFDKPQVFYGITIFSPLVNANPEFDNAVNLYTSLFKDCNSELLNEAEVAGLSFYFTSTNYGLQLQMHGYHHKMDNFLEKILKKLINFQIDPKKFDNQKEDYASTLKDYQTIPPLVLTGYYMAHITCSQSWSFEDKIAALDRLTIESLSRVHQSLFSCFSVELFLHGNLNKAHADNLGQLIQEKFIQKLNPTYLNEPLRPRQVMLGDGATYRFEAQMENSGRSNAILIFYEIGFNKLDELAKVKLVRRALDEPYFDQLRTKEQLGYSLSIGMLLNSGVYGLSCSLESEYSTEYLEERILCFMAHAQTYLENMPSNEFESCKKALASKLYEKEKRVSQISNRMWSSINSGEYDFRKKNRLAAEVEKLTQTDIIQFFKEFLSEDGPKRKQLSIHLISVKNAERGKEATKEAKPRETIVIKDIGDFKAHKMLYPIPMPKTMF